MWNNQSVMYSYHVSNFSSKINNAFINSYTIKLTLRSSLASTCYYGYVGNGWDVIEIYISAHNIYEHNRR